MAVEPQSEHSEAAETIPGDDSVDAAPEHNQEIVGEADHTSEEPAAPAADAPDSEELPSDTGGTMDAENSDLDRFCVKLRP